MRRRDFVLSAGAAALATGFPDIVRAQPSDDADDDHAAILDSVMSELELISGQRIDAVGLSAIPGETRSVLRRNGTDAGFAIPPLTPELRAALNSRRYWDLPEDSKPQPQWPRRAPDYLHLSAFPLTSNQFVLSAQILTTLAERNSFVINDLRPVLIFGLRGCQIVGGASESPWAMSHDLEAIDPTHLNTRCVIGVLRKSDGMIALFRGSTVPAVEAAYISLGSNGAGTSVLPTGLYAYSAGNHRPSGRIQRGALRIHGTYCVLRTADDVTFDAFSEGDAWTRGQYHNIHAAGLNEQKFQSNGCQVIRGRYLGADRMRSDGEWASFQRAAGLIGDDGAFIAPDTRPTFQYMLLTGREAAIAYHYAGRPAFENGYRRLRPGSSGEAVQRLQTRRFAAFPEDFAGATADGVFGMMTAFAELMHKKQTEREFTSPIVSI
jgi:hypothetical protein